MSSVLATHEMNRRHKTFMAYTSGVFFVASSLAIIGNRLLFRSGAVFIAPAVFSLGKVDPALQPESVASFSLHNETHQPLLISKTLTSCTCTSLDVSDMVVAPGEVAVLRMRIDSRRLRGRQQIAAQLWTDNPLYPYFELSADGDFSSSHLITPVWVTLPPAVAGQNIQHSYELSALRVNRLSSTRVFGAIEVRIESDIDRETGSSRLRFDGKAPVVPGEYTETISAQHDQHDSPVDVNLHLTALARIKASPDGVNFGVVVSGIDACRIVEFTDLLGQNIVSVEPVLLRDGISIGQVTRRGPVVEVEFVFRPAGNTAALEGELAVKVVLSDGFSAELQLPVGGRILAMDP